MNRPGALRFFWEILRPSRTAVAILLAVLLYAIYLATLSDEGLRNATGLLLLTQLLLASTGYRDRLVRGHFDPILASYHHRESLAFAHAALSMLPGLLVWVVFGFVDQMLTARRAIPMTSGGLAMFIYASAVVWSSSLWLGRNTGGMLWLTGLLVLAGAGKVHLLREAYGTVSADWLITARAAASALVVPIVMLENGGYVEPPVLFLVSAATILVLAAGIWTILRLDAPLKDPS